MWASIATILMLHNLKFSASTVAYSSFFGASDDIPVKTDLFQGFCGRTDFRAHKEAKTQPCKEDTYLDTTQNCRRLFWLQAHLAHLINWGASVRMACGSVNS